MWLHGCPPEEIFFNLKIDGRPFFGMKINNDVVICTVVIGKCSLYNLPHNLCGFHLLFSDNKKRKPQHTPPIEQANLSVQQNC